MVRAVSRRTEFRIGLVLAALVVGLAMVGPLFAPYTVTEFVAIPYSDSSSVSLLGTDGLGRDVLSRVLFGGRNLVWMSFLSATLGVAVGASFGLVAGYVGGRIDATIMRSLDVLLAFPSVVLILLVVSMLGTSVWLVISVVALAFTPSVARVIRGITKEISAKEYVEAAELLGYRRSSILFDEILPNITTPLLVEYSLRISWAITLLAVASFLGLGIQAPNADWGLMINENRAGLATQPWAVGAPAMCIAAFAIGTSLMSEGLSLTLAGIEKSTVSA